MVRPPLGDPRKALLMFESDHYIPILRGKAAEYAALGDTTDQIKDQLTPLIELPPIAWDPEESDSDEPDRSIAKLATNVERRWGPGRPFFLELGLMPSEPAIGGGIHPVDFVFNDCRSKELEAIPVTGPGRDTAFQGAVESAVKADDRGVCIRLSAEDFDDVEAAIEESDELLDQFDIGREDTDLILDFGAVSVEQIGPMVLAAVAVINSIPTLNDWRTLTWAGTSFPSVQNYRPQTVNTADRGEWHIWQAVRSRGSLSRKPSFADYTINGVQSDYDVSAAFYQSSPNLRYTAEDDFVIWKAKHPRHGFDQFNEICKSVVQRPEFRGADFSEGDAYIARCAEGNDGPGNATKWRQAGVGHHLASVADQIANLVSP